MAKGALALTNEALFRELDRLEAVDRSDPEAMAAEIERAKAVEGIAKTVVENGKLVVDLARVGISNGETIKVPKGLLGE